MTTQSLYEKRMVRCVELARRGAGAVSPNPMVGCVILDGSGEVLGEGWHQEFGGPHAEVHAIADVEKKHGSDILATSTLVVNLEPCSHHGKTPPCADLIIDKGIPGVVIGMTDPNPRVAGGGIRRLRDAGVAVTEDVLSAECIRLNEAFLRHTLTGRPLVTLKVAQTLDGCVATADGASRWISGEASRRRVHEMRARLDAVMVGSGTARADDPALTVRMTDGRQPWRVVLDRDGTLPADLRLFTDEHVGRTIAIVGIGCVPAYQEALQSRGGTVIKVAEQHGGHLDLSEVFATLGRGSERFSPIQSVLVEAGPSLATALVRGGLHDRLMLFIAPRIIGGTGVRTFGDLGVSLLSDAVSFEEMRWEQVGEDILFTGFRQSATDLARMKH